MRVFSFFRFLGSSFPRFLVSSFPQPSTFNLQPPTSKLQMYASHYMIWLYGVRETTAEMVIERDSAEVASS